MSRAALITISVLVVISVSANIAHIIVKGEDKMDSPKEQMPPTKEALDLTIEFIENKVKLAELECQSIHRWRTKEKMKAEKDLEKYTGVLNQLLKLREEYTAENKQNILNCLEDNKFYHCWTNRTRYLGVDTGFNWKDRLLDNEFYPEGTEVSFMVTQEPRLVEQLIESFTL